MRHIFGGLQVSDPSTEAMLSTGFWLNAAGHADTEMASMTNLSYAELLECAIERKAKTGTWKEWGWAQTGDLFTSQDDFRAFLFKFVYNINHNANWEKFLPAEVNGNVPESPSEAALRRRMAEVWKEVTDETKKQNDLVNEGNIRPAASVGNNKVHPKRTRSTQEEIVQATKEFHIEMIIKMMAALSKEHDLIYQLVSHPLVQFLVAAVRESVRETRYQVRTAPPRQASTQQLVHSRYYVEAVILSDIWSQPQRMCARRRENCVLAGAAGEWGAAP
jgi:hypothetical protein